MHGTELINAVEADQPRYCARSILSSMRELVSDASSAPRMKHLLLGAYTPLWYSTIL